MHSTELVCRDQRTAGHDRGVVENVPNAQFLAEGRITKVYQVLSRRSCSQEPAHSLVSVDEVRGIDLRILLKAAIHMWLRLVSPPVSQVAARLPVFESEQERNRERRHAPLQDQVHWNAEEIAIDEAANEERQRRDQQDEDEVLVFQVHERDASPKIAINGRFR